MSFAPRRKGSQKKQGKSSLSRASESSRIKSTDLEDENLRHRINLLEDVVAKLQMQHDMFEPLLSLLHRSNDVMALEDQARAFLDQAKVLEGKIESQHLMAKELEKKTAEVVIPPSLSEGQGSSSRSLPQMLNTLTDIEASVQAISMKRKVNAKKQEVSSKEQFIKVLTSLQTDLQQAQQSIHQQTKAFIKENLKKVDSLDQKGSQLKQRQKDDQVIIEDALEKHAMFGGSIAESWLHQQLNQRVTDSIQELNSHLQHKYNQLQLMFKQNLTSLRSTYQKVLADHHSVISVKKQTKNSVVGITDSIKDLKCRLQKSRSTQFTMLEEVSLSINQSLVQLNDKARRFVKSLKNADQNTYAETFANGKVDFDQWISGIWFNIDIFRTNLSKTEINFNADLYRLSQLVLNLQQQSSNKYDQIAPRIQNFKNSIMNRLDGLKNQLSSLKHRFFGLWRGLNSETNLNIEFKEKTTGDLEEFDQVEAEALDQLNGPF